MGGRGRHSLGRGGGAKAPWPPPLRPPMSMALAMALTRVIFSLPNMSLITLALRNEEEPKAKRVASRVKVLLASSPQLQ